MVYFTAKEPIPLETTWSANEGDPTNTDSATLTYTPNDGFTGEDSFTFLVNDGAQDSKPAAVSINVET